VHVNICGQHPVNISLIRRVWRRAENAASGQVGEAHCRPYYGRGVEEAANALLLSIAHRMES